MFGFGKRAYCPECGHAWDEVRCAKCGHTDYARADLTDVTSTVKESRVLGLIYSFDERYVLLIKHIFQNDPTRTWTLTGIGGRMRDEDGESPAHWIAQAAREITGLHIVDWMPSVTLVSPTKYTRCFMTHADSTAMRQAKPQIQTMDQPQVIAADSLSNYHALPLLRWLVPMHQDATIGWPLRVEVADLSPANSGPATVEVRTGLN